MKFRWPFPPQPQAEGGEAAGAAFPIPPERVFAILALVSGVFMVLATPPFQSPDEDAHFFRVFQLSEAMVIAEKRDGSVGGHVPVSAIELSGQFVRLREHGKVSRREIVEALREPFRSEPRQFHDFRNTAIYSPVAYIPSVIGMSVGRMAGISTTGLLYIARGADLLCWMVLVFAAIRFAPFFKWVIVVVALMPMSVFLASMLSADAMTVGLSILLVACILRSAVPEAGTIRWRHVAWMAFLAVLLALTKPIYFLLAAMTVIIPAGRLGGWKRKLLVCSGVVGAAVAANAIWAFAIRDIVTTEAWANPEIQLAFMLEEPMEFALVLRATLAEWWVTYIGWFVGVLGWLEVWLPWWIYPSYVAMLLSAGIFDRGAAGGLRVSSKAFVAVLCAVILLLIAAGMYITCTPPMAETIRGLQGRYAIPVALPMLLILHNRRMRLTEKWLGGIVTACCMAALMATCWTIVSRFYE